MGKRLTVSLVAVALVVAAVWGGRAYLKAKKPRRAANDVVTVAEGPIENAVEATGSVAPLNRVEIKPPISGRVEKLEVEEGDRVEAGQVLAWMSSSDRAAILDAARARGPEELAHWQDSYKPTPIIAPLSGLVILRNVVVGQTVEPSTVLFAMSDTLIVVAQVDESDVGRVRLGMPARVTLDSFPDRLASGKVSDILFEGKNVSNVIQYGVKIRINPVPSYFRSQMSANVKFILESKPRALLVPSSAVRDAGGGVKQVLLAGAEDQPPAMRAVRTGIETGDSVEILSGLEAGDRVLVARQRYVPQQGPQTSPLTMGGPKPTGPTGEAPRRRRNARDAD